MRRAAAAIALPILLASSLACSTSNRWTPKPLHRSPIEEQIRRNMAADGIHGMYIDVRNGIVTLSGTARSGAERDQAIRDARKVRGVSMIVNRIVMRP